MLAKTKTRAWKRFPLGLLFGAAFVACMLPTAWSQTKDPNQLKAPAAKDAKPGDQTKDQAHQAAAQPGDRETTKEDRDARTHARPERAPDVGLWFNRAAKGLEIADIASQGAISKLGFHEGDVVVSVNGQPVTRERDFMDRLFNGTPQKDGVNVVVTRNGREETIHVEPSALLEEYNYVENDPLENFGLVLDDRYPDRLVVWKVLPQSAAFYAGFRAGDVISTFNGKRLAALRDFGRLVVDTPPGEIAIDILRNNRARRLEADLPRYEARTGRTTTFRQDFDRRDNREQRRDAREDRRDQRRNALDGQKTTDKQPVPPTVPPTIIPKPTIPIPNPVNPITPKVPELPSRP